MTLVAQYDGDGTLRGRCDARCYNARHTKCTCICGGCNHGKGLQAALQQTREMFSELCRRAAEEGLRFRLASEVFQGSQDERQAAVSRVAP